MIIRKIKYFVLLISSLIIAGCGITGSQVPSDHYYRLPVAQVGEKTNVNFSRVLLRPVKVEGLYHERSILYVEQETPLEIKRYHYHYWVETPAKLVLKHIHSYLDQSSVAQIVTANPGHEEASVEITPTVVGFERLVEKGKYQNLVALRFDVSYQAGSRESWSKEYRIITDSASSAMHDTAKGFGEALDQIMTSLVADLSAK